MQKIFSTYNDPSHGWVKVKRSLLAKLNILHIITNSSYERKEFVYLEEDYDASTFHYAYVKAYGLKPIYKSFHTNRQSKIRRYPYFEYDSIDKAVRETGIYTGVKLC